MPKYSLAKKDEAYLTIEINGKTYNIPLANTLKVKKLRKIMKIGKQSEEEQTDFLFDFFGEYLGDEVVDDLTLPDLRELFELWGKANKEAGGLSLGESSASEGS